MTEHETKTPPAARTLLDDVASFAILAFAVSWFCWALVHEISEDSRSQRPAMTSAEMNK